MADKILLKNLFIAVLAIFLLNCVCADGSLIQGHINDTEGNSLAGIIIEVYETGDNKNPVAQTRTDNNGLYSISLKNGTYNVRIIGGSDSWIYQKTKVDYFRDVKSTPLEVADNSITEISITMGITPWDWISALVFVILCIIVFDQLVLLRRLNTDLIGLINTLFFRLRSRILLIINRLKPVPEIELEKEEPGTITGKISTKTKVYEDDFKKPEPKTQPKKELPEDIRLKTLQTFCPITKMKLREIPKNKLYLCSECRTYYHYDSIAPMKSCINCGTPVSQMNT